MADFRHKKMLPKLSEFNEEIERIDSVQLQAETSV